MRILILGAGEIGHAWAQAIERSPLADKIYLWPASRRPKPPIDVLQCRDGASVVEIAKEASRVGVDFVICCNQSLLALGITNALQVFRIPCFGPTRGEFQFLMDEVANGIEGSAMGDTGTCMVLLGANRIYETLMTGPAATRMAAAVALNETVIPRILSAFSREDIEFTGWLQITFVTDRFGLVVTDLGCEMTAPDRFDAGERDWLKKMITVSEASAHDDRHGSREMDEFLSMRPQLV